MFLDWFGFAFFSWVFIISLLVFLLIQIWRVIIREIFDVLEEANQDDKLFFKTFLFCLSVIYNPNP